MRVLTFSTATPCVPSAFIGMNLISARENVNDTCSEGKSRPLSTQQHNAQAQHDNSNKTKRREHTSNNNTASTERQLQAKGEDKDKEQDMPVLSYVCS